MELLGWTCCVEGMVPHSLLLVCEEYNPSTLIVYTRLDTLPDLLQTLCTQPAKTAKVFRMSAICITRMFLCGISLQSQKHLTKFVAHTCNYCWECVRGSSHREISQINHHFIIPDYHQPHCKVFYTRGNNGNGTDLINIIVFSNKVN